MDKNSKRKLPDEKPKREPHFMIKAKDGFLVSVPASRLEAWMKEQEAGESKLPDSVRQQAIEDLKRKLMEK